MQAYRSRDLQGRAIAGRRNLCCLSIQNISAQLHTPRRRFDTGESDTTEMMAHVTSFIYQDAFIYM